MNELFQTTNFGALMMMIGWAGGCWIIIQICDLLRYAMYLVLTGQDLQEVKNFRGKY